MDIGISDDTEYWTHVPKRQRFLKEVQERKGRPRIQWETRENLLNIFSSATFREMQSSPPEKLLTGVISHKHPPCAFPLSALKKIMLEDLCLETHHHGGVLVLRTIGHAVKKVVVQTAIEDETGTADRISIFNFDAALPFEKVLAEGVVFAVKEPFYNFTTDDGYTLTVDHPSDMVYLEDDHPLYPEAWKQSKNDTIKTAWEWKELGNKELKKTPKDWWTANKCYTYGLNAPESDNEMKRVLYRNRSKSSFELQRFEAAKADAVASLTPDASDVSNAKSFYREGRACYELGQYQNAYTSFKRALELFPFDVSAAAELKRCETRLDEEKGNLDLVALAASLRISNALHTDVANFTRRTEIRQTESRGRGLFATEYIPAGGLILCEKAFVAHRDVDDTQSHVLDYNGGRIHQTVDTAVRAGSIQKLFKNPSLAPRFLDLHTGHTPQSAVEVPVVDGLPVIDAFRIRRAIELNSFAMDAAVDRVAYRNTGAPSPLETSFVTSTGIWITASYMNHSCLFNGSRSFIGDLMIVRANRDIPKDAEITIPYKSTDPDVNVRREEMMIWGFECDCALCKADDRDKEDRQLLLEKISHFLRHSHVAYNKQPTPKAMFDAEQTLGRMALTYPAAIYGDLPRMGLVRLNDWLMKAHTCLGDTSKARYYAFSIICNYGCSLTHNKETNTLEFRSAYGYMSPRIVDALWFLRYDSRDKPLGREYTRLAREVYVIINGEPTGFEEEYQHDESLAESFLFVVGGR